MREATSKVGVLQQQQRGGGESDGSCHNRPSTNSLISRLRFQNENKNEDDEDVEVLVTKMMIVACICSCKGI